jgi:hypothetical protein
MFTGLGFLDAWGVQMVIKIEKAVVDRAQAQDSAIP